MEGFELFNVMKLKTFIQEKNPSITQKPHWKCVLPHFRWILFKWVISEPFQNLND